MGSGTVVRWGLRRRQALGGERVGVELQAKPRNAAGGILRAAQCEASDQDNGAVVVRNDALALARVQPDRQRRRRQVVGLAIGILGQTHRTCCDQETAWRRTLARHHVSAHPDKAAVSGAQRIAELQAPRPDGQLEEAVELKIDEPVVSALCEYGRAAQGKNHSGSAE
jgi:hypothetical protein